MCEYIDTVIDIITMQTTILLTLFVQSSIRITNLPILTSQKNVTMSKFKFIVK